jgi:hypothetical protein
MLAGAFSKVKNIVFSALGSITSLIGKFGSLAGGLSLGLAIKLGSDAEEMESMFQAVFRGGTEEAQKFAETLAVDIGRSSGDIMTQMAGFQDLFVPLGFAREEAAKLSKQMVTLTQDVGSFKNIRPEDVARSMEAGLIGSHRALRRFGIVITEQTLKEQLMADGTDKLTGKALELAKVQARLTLIMKGTADAQGDAARTSGSFENRMKGLLGAIKDVAGDIGKAFLPALANIAKVFTDVIRRMQPQIQRLSKMFANAGQVLTTNWQLTWRIIKQIADLGLSGFKDLIMQYPEIWAFQMGRAAKVVWTGMKAIWRIMQDITTSIVTGIQRSMEQGMENLQAFLEGRQARDLYEGGADGIIERIRSKMAKVGNAFGEGFTGGSLMDVLEPSQATLDKMAALGESVSELKDGMKAVEAVEAAKGADKKTGGDADATVGELKVRSMKLPTGFLDFDSANAKLQEAILKQADPQKEMVVEQKEGNRHLQNMVAGIRDVGKKVDKINTGSTGNLAVASQ